MGLSCTSKNIATKVTSPPNASMTMTPYRVTYDLSEVPLGAVRFTASIRNEGTTTITIAHPSVCFPADYKPGEIRRFNDSHGKSEILLKITKPNGTNLILRDGQLHAFDPKNVHLLTIPSGEIRTFDVGWFFQNARGRWERDDEAAEAFLLKGKYKIKILFRNFFPKAALYDQNTKESKFVDVWTGEIESVQVTVEIK
ncbi:MAG TPA: hypothetical protein VLK23_00580 [Thermodesulfobacteriota bacterium]|nr:hypothetical protein [Thermodesulfobacteriota bacterium]